MLIRNGKRSACPTIRRACYTAKARAPSLKTRGARVLLEVMMEQDRYDYSRATVRRLSDCKVSSVREPVTRRPLLHAMAEIERYRWVLLTSVNAVQHVAAAASTMLTSP